MAGNQEIEAEKSAAKKTAQAKNAFEKKLEKMSVEQTFDALDELIERLENGQGSLEDAFSDYETGMKLVKGCNEKIDKIEKQVLVLSGEQPEDEKYGGF